MRDVNEFDNFDRHNDINRDEKLDIYEEYIRNKEECYWNPNSEERQVMRCLRVYTLQ